MSGRLTTFAVLTVLVAGLAFGLAACGKKGNLKPPAQETVPFPRTYPTQ